MSFNELLNQDLPSRSNKSFLESADEYLDDEAYLESLLESIYDESNDDDEEFMKGGKDKYKGGDPATDDVEPPADESKIKITEEYDDEWDDDDLGDIVGGDDDDDDIDSLSDDELEQLDQELSGKMIDSVVGRETPQKLSPDEEMQADDMMSVAATAAIVNDEMNAEEKAQFIESERDVQIAINEGLLMESDIQDIANAAGKFITENNYNKKMIIRLDKNAKMKQLYAIGVNVSAAAHKDPDYYKLKKVNRIRRTLQSKLRKKYHGEALKRMRVYMKRLMSSKSKTLSNIGKKITGK